jgi:hypothetical protein
LTTRRFIEVTIAIASVIGAGVIASGTALAAPASNEGCTFGTSSGNVKTCDNIITNGSRVASVEAFAIVVSSTRKLMVCVTNGNGTEEQCSNKGGFVSVSPGNEVQTTWAPSGGAPAGTYCAITYRENSGGSSTQIGSECLPSS